MRKDLVAEVIVGAQELFEDVFYTPPGGAPVFVERAIFGVEIADERFDFGGQAHRTATHTTLALLAKLPGLGKGAQINDGNLYEVLGFEAAGDGRFEIRISLRKLS